MFADTMKGEGKGFDVTAMAKAWKEGYLKGLEACLQSQEETEHLMKNAIKQGFTVPRQWLGLYKEWVEMPWDQIQGQAPGMPNPFLTLTRQYTQAVHATIDPLLKTSEAVYENTFGYYESTIAGPSRKYMRDINEQVMDTIIPG